MEKKDSFCLLNHAHNVTPFGTQNLDNHICIDNLREPKKNDFNVKISNYSNEESNEANNNYGSIIRKSGLAEPLFLGRPTPFIRIGLPSDLLSWFGVTN